MNIIDRVEELRYNTLTNIENIQKAKIPVVYKLELERRYSFNTHGFYHSAYDETWLLYVCKNLPYNPNQTRHVFADNLLNMVNNKEIKPFLLFIDEKLVKWSDIEIINDCKFSYILIKNNENLETPKCECILLPENIEYKENSNNITDNTIFTFDSQGLCVYTTIQDHLYTIIDLKDKNVFSATSMLEEGKKQKTIIDSDFKISSSNFILFRNGFLETTADIEVHGLNVYSVNKNVFYGNEYICKQFYYTESNKSKDNITNPCNRNIVVQRLSNNTIPEYMLKLAESFDFTFDKNLEYEENIKRALAYIMSYNTSLMNDIYKQTSNIESRIYKGSDLKLLMDETGYVSMSRRISGQMNNYPIIFHNGNLYNYYNQIEYKHKNFKFPVVDVSDTDIIEIMFFKNIDNRTYPLYLPSGDSDIRILDSTIDINHMKLYTINTEINKFNIERTERTQYEVPFTAKRLEDNNIELKLGDSFHYDRNLTLASDRQFRYMSKVLQENAVDVMLSSDFNFCTERNKYMVFINGRKIDNSNFKVTIAKANLPFDDISVYLNLPLVKGDKIEIFYVSEPLEEISLQPKISNNGIVVINRDKISYDLDEELYLVFINGRKMNSTDMKKMNSNRLKIVTDLKSIKNVSIIKHISDNTILATIFKSIHSDIDNIYDNMELLEIQNIFQTYNTYTDDEKDIKQNEVSMDQVLYHIIQDYYMRPYINNGDVFDYEFDEFESELGQDSDKNNIITTMDATKEDKLEP